MIISSIRHESKKASIEALKEHCDYHEDATHPNHVGLTIHPACNYNCGPTTADFVSAVEGTQAKYLEVRDGKPGKRDPNLWEEVICCMGEGCYHTKAERDAIELMMIAKICPDSPARAIWHENPVTGKDILIIIFPTKNTEGKPNQARRLKIMQALDEQIANLLNTSRCKPANRKKLIQTAREVAKDRARKLGKPLTPKPIP